MIVYLQLIETEEHRTKFERIYTEYRGLMYHTAYQLLRHEQDAEDAVHLAFVSIAENIAKIEDIGPKTKSYVAVIAESKAIDMLRRRQRLGAVSLNQEITGIEIEYDGNRFLTECINRLPALQRQVVWLKYHYGYDLWEIAKILKISHAWATKLDQRAKKKLRQLLEEENHHAYR